MRQKADIRKAQEPVRNIRLVVEDVEAGSRDRAGLQRCDQRILVDTRAAADIDEHAVRAKRRKDLRREDLVGRRRSRNDRNQRVHRFRHLLQRRVVSVAQTFAAGAGVIADLNLERFEALGNLQPDTAEPENADLAALERQRRQRERPVLLPVTLAQVVFRAGKLADGVEQQRNRGVGHLVVQHVGRMRDDDAMLHRLLRVDAVVANAEIRHDLEVRKRVDPAIVQRA